MSLNPVTINNAIDTWVSEAEPSRSFPTTERFSVEVTGTVTGKRGLIYFARPFPLGSTIISAVLRIYGADEWPAATRDLSLERITSAWIEGTVTWDTQPTTSSADAVTVQKTALLPDGEAWEFAVEAHMQLLADGGTEWYGWMLKTNEAALREFYSAQAGDLRPVLEVTYALPPSTPTTLSPSGGRAVSISHPTLRFDYLDQAGNTALTKIQVQLNPTDDWASPAFDSTELDANSPTLDLSVTAYGGLALDASTYWRCRLQDVSGLWSDWSAAALFQRKAKPTVTITNPAASPNDFVEDASPPITWTVTGGVQTAWQVVIADIEGNWLYNSGKVLGTATSHAVPSGYINDATTYVVLVRVWDTVDREGTPGDPAYTEASRTFDYQLNGAVTAATGLTATTLGPEPGVRLDWDRSSLPDRWTIVRDGKVVADRPGADLFVSGTSYQFTDDGARPNTQHTYEVRAVVNNQTSASNPTVQATVLVQGIWLTDPERGIAVQLLDQDPGTWAMGEDAVTHRPRGAQKPVRITQTLGGYEGSLAGRIVGHNGVTVQEWEERVWQIKAKPGRTYWLTMADLSIPVILGNIVITPLPNAEINKMVSFDFWQVGNFTFEATL